MIKNGGVEVGGVAAKKPGMLVKPDAEITVLYTENTVPDRVLPNSALECEVLYTDANIVIINKPLGMLTHPTTDPASFSESAASWLLAHGGQALENILRPGIVHRLDKWTSGCLLLAKTDAALHFYASAFEKRHVTKEYLALVEGRPAYAQGTIDAPIGRDATNRVAMGLREDGRASRTSYSVLAEGTLHGQPVSLLRLELHTGRTHQIRVHLSSIGHPVVGDATYGSHLPHKLLAGQWLHAWQLTVPNMQEEGQIHVTASLPASFQQILDETGIGSSWQED